MLQEFVINELVCSHKRAREAYRDIECKEREKGCGSATIKIPDVGMQVVGCDQAAGGRVTRSAMDHVARGGENEATQSRACRAVRSPKAATTPNCSLTVNEKCKKRCERSKIARKRTFEAKRALRRKLVGSPNSFFFLFFFPRQMINSPFPPWGFIGLHLSLETLSITEFPQDEYTHIYDIP